MNKDYDFDELLNEIDEIDQEETPEPTPEPTPTPTPTNIIDPMDSIMVWNTYNDDKGSSMNIKIIPGRTNKALEITYDLKERGWVTINKQIDPKILSEIEGVTITHIGEYDKVGLSYKKLIDYVNNNNYIIEPQIEEMYVKGPGILFKGNTSKYITKLFIPIRN